MQAVVCHEVAKPDWIARCVGRWVETDRITSSFNSALASPSNRIFGIKVNDLALVKALYRSNSITPDAAAFAYLIEFSFDRCLLVLGCRAERLSQSKLNNLRRPGLNTQKEIFNTLNLAAKDDSTVYSTLVSNGHLPERGHGSVTDGWLHLEMNEKDADVNFEYIRELCTWVAMERALINASIAELVRRPRRFEMSTSRLSKINSWLRDSITNPPVDKSVFIKYMNDLRESLNLVALRDELSDRSNRASQNRNIVIAGVGFVLTAAFSILTFIFPPVFEWFG